MDGNRICTAIKMDVQQQAMDVDEDDVRQAKKESLRAKFDLKDDMIDEVLDCFELFDADNTGTIDERELGKMFRALGANPTEEEIQHALTIVDINKNGVIDIDEFCCMFSKCMQQNWQEKLTRAFQVFDKDHNGFVSRSEMEMVFGAIRYGQDVQQEVNEMMDVLDKNKDGFIDYKEFVDLFCGGGKYGVT